MGFVNRLDDGVVRVGYPGTTRFVRINRDRTDAVGAELTLGWRGAGGGAVQMEFVGQHVRISEGALGGSGRKPEHVPALRAHLNATAPTRAGVVLGASLQHLGAQYCVNPETDRDVPLSRQTILGATAERRWRWPGARGVRLLLGLDNLTDAAVYDQCGLPRPGRTLRVGITVH